MFCKNCGSNLSNEVKYCEKCGTPVDTSSSDSSSNQIPPTPPPFPNYNGNPPKKSNTGKFIIAGIGIFIALVVMLVFFGLNDPISAVKDGTSIHTNLKLLEKPLVTFSQILIGHPLNNQAILL